MKLLKGSEQAPLSSLRLGELCDGIFPAGVVNIIAGDGDVGAALVRHPDVRRIGYAYPHRRNEKSVGISYAHEFGS
jgi:acyl-CoA reductase-like NAD-dependent aldehyde dehydrogenase